MFLIVIVSFSLRGWHFWAFYFFILTFSFALLNFIRFLRTCRYFSICDAFFEPLLPNLQVILITAQCAENTLDWFGVFDYTAVTNSAFDEDDSRFLVEQGWKPEEEE